MHLRGGLICGPDVQNNSPTLSASHTLNMSGFARIWSERLQAASRACSEVPSERRSGRGTKEHACHLRRDSACKLALSALSVDLRLVMKLSHSLDAAVTALPKRLFWCSLLQAPRLLILMYTSYTIADGSLFFPTGTIWTQGRKGMLQHRYHHHCQTTPNQQRHIGSKVQIVKARKQRNAGALSFSKHQSNDK